ncbi:MAG: hypothetical protein IJM49_02935 [Firmicutes bacterium]|nr:hypothetical protein [Bacillota bacterium]
MTAIAEQIAHISKIANAWCNFAIVCGCIGLALSLTAAIILIKIIKEENHDRD